MAINEPYKIEILESIKEDPITIYHIGMTCHCLLIIVPHVLCALVKACHFMCIPFAILLV